MIGLRSTVSGLAFDGASPPSLSAIAKVEGLSKQTVFRLRQDPRAALAVLDAWACDGARSIREPRSHEPHAFHPISAIPARRFQEDGLNPPVTRADRCIQR